MLYLAEVQKKSGVIRSGKAELKLLACQRGENSWSAVPGEEIIPAPEDANYSAGALVMIELSGNRQIQRHSEAGRQLVSILQNFSRVQERFKTQEEEIEQWKQSLTYQSQELNRREMEMEARQEQLQQMEEDFVQLEQQRQEIETRQADVERLKDEFERKSEELEGAWAHLRGEMSRFEEMQSQAQQSAGLDEEKAQQLQELLNRLAGAIAPTEAVREQLNGSFEIITQQQGAIDQHYQNLDQQRNSAQQLQGELEQSAQHLQTRWHEWKQLQVAFEQAKADLSSKQRTLQLKQEYAQVLATQIKHQEDLSAQVCQLAESSDRIKIGGKVDVAALENMPLEELEALVRELEQDLEKVSRFVNSQEEELTLQQETINDLKRQIEAANDYDRLGLESELTDEQDRYQMLNETLVGQRRTLQERRNVLGQHQLILDRRKGNISGEAQPDNDIDLSPVLDRLEATRQELSQELHSVQAEIQEMQGAIEQAQITLEQQAQAQESSWNEIQQLEQTLQGKKHETGELWGKVNAYQDSLQLAQDSLGSLKEKLEAIANVMGQFQEVSDYQLQAIAEMRQTILSVTQSQTPEFVAS